MSKIEKIKFVAHNSWASLQVMLPTVWEKLNYTDFFAFQGKFFIARGDSEKNLERLKNIIRENPDAEFEVYYHEGTEYKDVLTGKGAQPGLSPLELERLQHEEEHRGRKITIFPYEDWGDHPIFEKVREDCRVIEEALQKEVKA